MHNMKLPTSPGIHYNEENINNFHMHDLKKTAKGPDDDIVVRNLNLQHTCELLNAIMMSNTLEKE